jgi:NADP-dependent 3-hydroxy acid dehydrogenase YdfG
MLITGASTGIGAATARQAVAAGYRVVLAARSEDKLRDLASELGGDEVAIAQRCDVAQWDDQEALMRAALDAFGRVDVVFANAGFGAARGFLKETPEHWRAMVETNVLGVAYSIRAALPTCANAGPATSSSRARSPGGVRCPDRCTRPRSTRSPRSVRRCARSCETTRAPAASASR